MNASEIYEKCRSKELITSFNRSGLCISYKTMKKHRNNLAKYTIVRSMKENQRVPLPSHFCPSKFTLAAFDNFDHGDKNTISGKFSAHDTAITLFQEKPAKSVSKPLKSNIELNSVSDRTKLDCQNIIPYTSNRGLPIPESFKVENQTFHSTQKTDEHDMREFIMSYISSASILDTTSNIAPTWAGLRSLLSEEVLPKMQVGFLPFIPHPVTEYSTVYTALKNFMSLVEHLDQGILPVFCDEGVYRIVLDIFLNKPTEFCNLLLMMGGFHMAKCALHCIGKLI